MASSTSSETTLDTNFVQGILGGDVLNTAFPPQNFRAGTWLFLIDGGGTGFPAVYFRGGSPSGTPAWLSAISGTSSSGGLSSVQQKFFSGTITNPGGGTLAGYPADALAAVQSNSIQYPVNTATTARRLIVRVPANTLTTATTFEVYKNNVATGLSVSVGAGLTGAFTAGAPQVAFAANDGIDLFVGNTAGGGANAIRFSAQVVLY